MAILSSKVHFVTKTPNVQRDDTGTKGIADEKYNRNS